MVWDEEQEQEAQAKVDKQLLNVVPADLQGTMLVTVVIHPTSLALKSCDVHVISRVPASLK